MAQDNQAQSKGSAEGKKPVQLPGVQPGGSVLLPNGWSLKPAGKQTIVGDFPVHAEYSPDGNYVAILHAGYGEHEIRTFAAEPFQQIGSVRLDQAFFGLSFSADGKTLAASGAEDEIVYLFDFQDGFLSNKRRVRIVPPKEKWVVSGIAFAEGNRLLACGLLGDQITNVDLADPNQMDRIDLMKESFPYSVLPTKDGKRAYVSLWGQARIALVDLADKKVLEYWDVRSHPTEMVLLNDEKRLLVACSNDNSVVALDTASGKIQEVIRTSLFPKSPNGSTTASLCVDPDQNVLLVANADNNHLALFDIATPGKSKSLGFIPTGWYPTSVRVAADGEHILVTNGKGIASKSNRSGPNPLQNSPGGIREYIGGLFQGTTSLIPTPNPIQMAAMTKAAFDSSPLTDSNGRKGHELLKDNPIPSGPGMTSPIKHCIYVIKENRTYDQVFGDIPKGNGDPNLCIFPENVTPNHHALVNEYVLLDNFYVDSEVSADGHEWTMAAYATDFVEKTWPLSYRGGKGKLGYPAEGKFKIAEPSSGYFWDSCKAKGVSYFSFGEFVNNGATPTDPAWTKVDSLQGHFDPQFRCYDLEYSDLKRADRFLERWKQFEDEGNVPGFVVVRLPNDHTYGTRVGKPTPTAMVAENDLALGKLVEGISKSKSWKETAIFVVEDDAQNGADHVDAHRTVALAISPYTKRGHVDSTLYSTSSMLRTMGLILGLDPMTQFDASANPMYDSFQSKLDDTPYQAREAQVDLSAKNTPESYGAILSEGLDLTKEDAADDLLFGDIVWRSIKGADHPMPAPVRSAFVFASFEEEEDDDDEMEEDEDD